MNADLSMGDVLSRLVFMMICTIHIVYVQINYTKNTSVFLLDVILVF